ncbi:MAG: TIGR01440 family protein [Oscillospiraceae bacterium]|nr:TIGR01440 family protein [Oscillospiraceae bacterium]
MIQTEPQIDEIKKELEQILDKFILAVSLNPDDILVIGCSTSEVAGGTIGKNSSYPVGAVIVRTFIEKFKPLQVNLAFQCCEHLNRALVVERELVKKRNNLEIVAVIPQEKAGGSAASAAYKFFSEPVLVEFIKADAGIDIGDTFVGMHLKHVVVPVRLDLDRLGAAHMTFAKTRPKYIGGERAKYSIGE